MGKSFLLLFFVALVGSSSSIDYFVLTGNLSSPDETCTAQITIGEYGKTLPMGDFSFLVPSIYLKGKTGINLKSVNCKHVVASPSLYVKSIQPFEGYCKK